MAHVSRWSKYTDQTAEGPNGHEDEEEDENVYTEIRTDSEAKEPGTTQHSYFSIKAFNLLIRQTNWLLKIILTINKESKNS